MEILLANKFFYINGGSERVFFQERDFLLKKGTNVIDFSMQDKRNFDSPFAEYFVNNIDYAEDMKIPRKLKSAFSLIHSREAVRKIKKLLAEKIPDIAHLHNIYHQLTPSIIRPIKSHGVKVVLTLHDYKLICPSYIALNKEKPCIACNGVGFWNTLSKHCQKSFSQEFLLMWEGVWHKWRKSYENVDLFLSPSSFLAKQVSKRVENRKIEILRNGIDTQKFIPKFDDAKYYLFFGRLSKEKGIETLGQAHKLTQPFTNLKVVGSGPLEMSLREAFPEIDILGYKTGKELKALIRNAAFVIVPSKCYENCSMVVLEAMAYGKPVIGSRIGGIPEQIEDEKTGFLFEMGNVLELAEKILRLWNNKALRNEMGKNARIKLEREYSLEKHCDNLISIYNQVLSN